MSFHHVCLDGETMDLVVSGDDVAIAFAVYPEDEDYAACPRRKKKAATEPGVLELPTSVMDDLVRWRAALVKMESSADVLLAIIAGSQTLESMRSHWRRELAQKGIELVEYPDYRDFLGKHFDRLPGLDDDDEDDDD